MRQGVKVGCIALAAATIALCAGCQNAPTNLKEAYADYFPIGVPSLPSRLSHFIEFSQVTLEKFA